MIIYKATNKINAKIYIGQTIKSLENRFAVHLWGKTPFSNALKKYGINSFDISVIDSADTKEILNEKEKYWIKFYNSKVPNGYNLTDGGEGILGIKHSEETKHKISKSHLGKMNSKETREKLSESHKGSKNQNFGKHFSEEHRMKMSVAHKGKNLGRHLSDETKLKISKKLTGKIFTNETKLKLSHSAIKRERLKRIIKKEMGNTQK